MSPTVPRLAFDPPTLSAEALAEACVPTVQIEAPSTAKSLLGQLCQRWASDDELALQLRGGNAEALSVLFKRHNQLIFGIARRILGDAAEAEDAVQQVFFDVFRSIHQFNPEKGGFKPWLLMFAYQRSFNIRRALCASRVFKKDPIDEVLPDLLIAANGHRAYSYPEMRILVEQALRSAPLRERRAIELVYYGGLTAEEVAARTGETVRVVRHNLYRGLDKLRKVICKAHNRAEVNGKEGPQ
ncbi:MAG TPA: sigma-70 family RNA polymerase sigma factor [Terracidiphilus sp.]